MFYDIISYMKNIIFSKKLYMDDSLKKKEKRIMWKLQHFKRFVNLYLILWPQGVDGQLEIMHSSLLRQEYYKTNTVVVVGFSKSYVGAVDIIVKLAKSVLKETGDIKIKEYIAKKNEELSGYEDWEIL